MGMDNIGVAYGKILERAAKIRSIRRKIYGDNFIDISEEAHYGNLLWKIERARHTTDSKKFEDDIIDAINLLVFICIKRRHR